MKFHLKFYKSTITPTCVGEYLLYNRCDGFHIAEAKFDDEKNFMGFFRLPNLEFDHDTYHAWAVLPESTRLFEKFVAADQ